MVIVWGSVEAAAGKLEEVLELSREHVQRSRAEPGCLQHGAYVDADQANRVVFFEQWRDLASLQAHFAVAESRHFVARLSGLAASRPEMRVFQASELNL